MRTYKGKNTIQYGRGGMTICVTRAEWRKKHGITKNNPTLFVGSAYGLISQELAAGIIRQWRKGGGE